MRNGIWFVEVVSLTVVSGGFLRRVYPRDDGFVFVGEPGVPVAVAVLPDVAHFSRQLLGIQPLTLEPLVVYGFFGGELLRLAVGDGRP